MSTLTATADTSVLAPSEQPAVRPITMSRIIAVELRKMFDTRSGFWLMVSIGVLAGLATGAVILWADDASLTYDSFAAAIGLPMTVILPVIALLSITSEWSQRTGLATFTFVPSRSRVIAAKAACTLAIGVVSMLVAAAMGAVGNIVGSGLAGVPTVWNLSVTQFSMIVLGTVLNMLIGFMLGLLLRSSAAALVAYFVYQFVLSSLTVLLASTQEWFAHIQPWVDFNFSQGQLFDVVPSAEQWAQLGVSGFFWLALPLAIGLRLVLRSEVK